MIRQPGGSWARSLRGDLHVPDLARGTRNRQPLLAQARDVAFDCLADGVLGVSDRRPGDRAPRKVRYRGGISAFDPHDHDREANGMGGASHLVRSMADWRKTMGRESLASLAEFLPPNPSAA